MSESGKKKARLESLAYSNIVNLGYINNGESLQVKTLVPIGARPQLKLTIQPENSKEVVTINK